MFDPDTNSALDGIASKHGLDPGLFREMTLVAQQFKSHFGRNPTPQEMQQLHSTGRLSEQPQGGTVPSGALPTAGMPTPPDAPANALAAAGAQPKTVTLADMAAGKPVPVRKSDSPVKQSPFNLEAAKEYGLEIPPPGADTSNISDPRNPSEFRERPLMFDDPEFSSATIPQEKVDKELRRRSIEQMVDTGTRIFQGLGSDQWMNALEAMKK